VIWATGFRPDHSWLHVPALDRKGRLRHDGGVVDVPGLYALGLNSMRRRKSSFIHGAEHDVRDIATHLVAYLQQRTSVRGDAPDAMARSQDPVVGSQALIV
jgi:putative flavoprotein involved in K+ transport